MKTAWKNDFPPAVANLVQPLGLIGSKFAVWQTGKGREAEQLQKNAVA